jgi:Fe-S cluster biogenesis protein NfuA
MDTQVKEPVSIYTEMTPNPETLKFVLNRMLLANNSADFPSPEQADQSPLASELFGFPFVAGVFISQNFVTITKDPTYKWEDVIGTLKEFIKTHISEERMVMAENWEPEVSEEVPSGDSEEVVTKIKELLETYVKPAVEMDGGAIQYKSFEDGVVTVQLQGACSGCPSSTVTLKAGIEGMMKRMLPEVKEVVAESV